MVGARLAGRARVTVAGGEGNGGEASTARADDTMGPGDMGVLEARVADEGAVEQARAGGRGTVALATVAGDGERWCRCGDAIATVA